MSLCDDRGLFATDKEMARRRSCSCVEGRINQCFLKVNYEKL